MLLGVILIIATSLYWRDEKKNMWFEGASAAVRQHVEEKIFFAKAKIDGFCVAKYWKAFFEEVPEAGTMLPVVQGILCIPASAAKCERKFSYTTALVNSRTQRLSHRMIEMKSVIKHGQSAKDWEFEGFVEFCENDDELTNRLERVQQAVKTVLRDPREQEEESYDSEDQ